ILAKAREAGLRLPLLLRFPQIIEDRAQRLQAAFDAAIQNDDYTGAYTPVFPIKVNQQRSVVETLAARKGVGLEAGSKPELIAVLALSQPGGLVVCNGYKDREYIRLALLGQKLGLRVYIVVEKPKELPLILEESERLQVEPLIGARMRLSAVSAGKWRDSGGERAKFGLAASQLVDMVETLHEAGKLDRLQMLHFHMGSQISSIRDIHRGAREAGRYLVELREMGAPVGVVDIGGGLAVDYEGNRSRGGCSMNYTLSQYAAGIVGALKELCDAYETPHPDIVSESGRALVAHHALMLANISAVEDRGADVPDEDEDEPAPVASLRRILDELDEHSPQEGFLEAAHFVEEGHHMFLYGELTLAHRACLEQLHQAVLHRVRERLDPERRAHRELFDRVNESLADKYFLNLSIFQSLPDVWAIEQVFPIVPIARLDERPVRRGVLEDLTCDSDGRIDRFVEHGALESNLALHPLRAGEEYVLGVFMVGAYQETLGDIHNLFGDTDSAVVRIGADGVHLGDAQRGEHAARLLEYVGFARERLESGIADKVRASELADEHALGLQALLTHSLDGYTYLAAEDASDDGGGGA
ncbi:MAG: biosynthetic arginine decarboxylase, partial [Xanthomonadales bacterium]|nr:biosynthetic arginine decarboxylase [Xanthomonadales bacterium]